MYSCRGSSQPRDQTQLCLIEGGFFTSEPPGKPKNTGVGSLSLCQGNFLTQESNQGLLHCRQILYQLSYQGVIYIWIYILLSWDSVPPFVKSSPHRTIVRIKWDNACQTTILVPDIHWGLGNVSFYVFFENPILGQREKIIISLACSDVYIIIHNSFCGFPLIYNWW